MATEEAFNDFLSAVTDSQLQSITRPNGAVWDISELHAREAVARYLFAELRYEERLLKPSRQEQLWDFIFSMDQGTRPFIFDRSINNKSDPRREALDRYFKKTAADGQIPMMAEAMTPQQLVSVLTRMSVDDNSPFTLRDFVTLITDYQGQFGQEAASEFIYNVIYIREEQLRTGSNPEPAIYGLLEAMPYIREMDTVYQADVLAHIIDGGMVVSHNDPDTWKNSTHLYNLLQESLTGLGAVVYPEEDYYVVDKNALLVLFRHINYLRGWKEYLPYSLGEDADLTFLLRDLELMNMVRGEQRELLDESSGRRNGQNSSDAQLNQLLAKIDSV